MKYTLITAFILIMGFSSCSSQKKLVKQPPFEIGQATCRDQLAGREESGNMLILKVPIRDIAEQGISFQKAFFRERVCTVETRYEDGETTLTGTFPAPSGKPDIIMHSDPKKEVGNQPPTIKSEEERDFPFDLKPDEAVLSYIVRDQVKYVKVTGIQQKPARVLPSKPQE